MTPTIQHGPAWITSAVYISASVGVCVPLAAAADQLRKTRVNCQGGRKQCQGRYCCGDNQCCAYNAGCKADFFKGGKMRYSCSTLRVNRCKVSRGDFACGSKGQCCKFSQVKLHSGCVNVTRSSYHASSKRRKDKLSHGGHGAVHTRAGVLHPLEQGRTEGRLQAPWLQMLRNAGHGEPV